LTEACTPVLYQLTVLRKDVVEEMK